MGFVILMGLQALHELCVNQYEAEVHQQLEALKTAIQETVKQRAPRTHDFDLPKYTCGGKVAVRVALESKSDRPFCSTLCQTSTPTCWSLTYSAGGDPANPQAQGGDIRQAVIRKCVVIDPAASFIAQENACATGGGCPPGRCADRLNDVPAGQPRWRLINFADPQSGSPKTIPSGVYELLDRTPELNPFPVICAYHKEGSS